MPPDDFDDSDIPDDFTFRRLIDNLNRKIDNLDSLVDSACRLALAMSGAFGWIVARLNIDDRFNEVMMRTKDLEKKFGVKKEN